MAVAPQTTNPSSSQTTAAQKPNQKILSFPNSSYRYTVPFSGSIPLSNLSIATANTLNDIEVPPYGYLRSLRFLFTLSGGAGTAVTAAGDAPWNLINSITFFDASSDPIVTVSGYQLYLINKYGGFGFTDPKLLPSYSAIAAATGDASFALNIPIEILSRMGLGALANMNSSATYKVNIITNPASVVYGTVPTTLPVLTVTLIMKAWAKPPATDLLGNQLTTAPPLSNTTQYLTSQSISNLNGMEDMQIKRVGNYIRNLIFVSRNSSTQARQDVLPTGAALKMDNVPRTYLDSSTLKDDMSQLFRLYNAEESAGGLDTGVFVLPYTNDLTNNAGDELRNLYLPTLSSSFLVVSGTWSNTTFETIVNDVAPAGDMFTNQLL